MMPVTHPTLRTILLCLLGAVLEGIDLQAAAVAAPKLAAALQLDKATLGWVFSATTTGLMLGAILGGYAADRIGRKRVLLISMLCFGLFSIGTAWVNHAQPLFLMRLLTGIGLGGAMPNLIALAAENSPDATRSRWASFMYAGIPLGGAVASWVALLQPNSWRIVFITGGLLPLLVVPLMAIALPESQRFAAASTTRSTHGSVTSLKALFGDGQAWTTVLLWLSASLTLLVIYSVYNWMPTLLLGRGFAGTQVSMVQLVLSVGGMIGTLLMGAMMDTRWRTLSLSMTYTVVTAALVGLAMASPQLAPTSILAFVIGAALQGSTVILFVIAPLCYDTLHRGTGVGASVAAGRLGAIAGPIIVGIMTNRGVGIDGVLLSMTPVSVVTLVTAALLTRRVGEQRHALI